jgi:antitoxin CptB
LKKIERIRWRCRRGLLELDIVLGRFVDRHYGRLDEAQRAAFDILLEVPDALLWDMITGRQSPPQDDTQQRNLNAVLALLRTT